MSMYPTHDPDTGLRVLIKQPSESRIYKMNFSDLMGDSPLVSVSSLDSESQENVPGSANVDLGAASIVGPRVQFNIAGGIDGEDYKITVRVTDGDGNLIEGEGMLYVRDL
jgi:hypothetical protein